MEIKSINEIWEQQTTAPPQFKSQQIIKQAVAQRRKQKTGIAVMCITVGILTIYAVWQLTDEINMFIVGLYIMIASLLVRIAIEIASNLKKVSGMVDLDGKQYLEHLKRFYNWRKRIHFVITPICFAGYLFGLWQLFPYFKREFSNGFYIYLVASAIISLAVIAAIIFNQVRKELVFLKSLSDNKTASS